MTAPSHPRLDAVDPIVEELATVHQQTGRQYGTVFQDWVDLLVAMCSGDDDLHAKILARYDDLADRTWVAEQYSVATARFLEATIEVQHEILGAVYGALGARSDALGQHFTPYAVADAKAAMLLSTGELATAEGREEPFLVGDPACGSGRLLIAVAKRVHAILTNAETDIDRTPLPPIVYCGKDTDQTCAKMTAVNLAIARQAGYAIHGNTLTNETLQVWRSQPTQRPPLVDHEDSPDPFVVEADEADETAEVGKADPVVDPAGAAGGADTDSDLAEQVNLGRWGQ